MQARLVPIGVGLPYSQNTTAFLEQSTAVEVGGRLKPRGELALEDTPDDRRCSRTGDGIAVRCPDAEEAAASPAILRFHHQGEAGTLPLCRRGGLGPAVADKIQQPLAEDRLVERGHAGAGPVGELNGPIRLGIHLQGGDAVGDLADHDIRPGDGHRLAQAGAEVEAA